jgi:hypothetical protein
LRNPFRRKPTEDPARRAPAEGEQPAEPALEAHQSLALAALLDELRSRPRVAVLDLGPARPENVAFFARLQCRLHVEDLYRTLAGRGGLGLAEDVLRLPPEPGFDAVLAWDLFDYMETEVLVALAPRLAALCRPGALLFALVSYLGTIPDRPLDFRLGDGDTLRYAGSPPRRRPGPRRAAREMERLLAGFRFRSSYLLRSGYQEFLFVRS